MVLIIKDQIKEKEKGGREKEGGEWEGKEDEGKMVEVTRSGKHMRRSRRWDLCLIDLQMVNKMDTYTNYQGGTGD